MREEKNVRIKNDGSQIFRLPVKKISGFLGSVMFLSCLAFPLPTFAEEALFTEEAASGNKKSEEKETLIYESPIFTDGGEAFIPEETRSEGERNIGWYQNESEMRKSRRNNICPGDNSL